MTYEFLPQEEPGKPLVTLPPGFTESVMERIADYERRQKRRWTTAIALTALCLVAGAFALSARRFDDRRTPDAPRMQAGPETPVAKRAPLQQQASSRDTVKPETSVRAPVADRAAGGWKEPAPAVKTAPLQQQASSQDTVKQGAPVPASIDGVAIASCQPCSAEVPPAKVIYVQRAVFPGDAVKSGTPVTHAVGLVQLPADTLARTGLRPGDIVIMIDGKEIQDTSQAATVLKTRDNCKPLRIELLREGKLLTFVIHSPSDAGNSPCGDEP